jgi:hypothetical protein
VEQDDALGDEQVGDLAGLSIAPEDRLADLDRARANEGIRARRCGAH